VRFTCIAKGGLTWALLNGHHTGVSAPSGPFLTSPNIVEKKPKKGLISTKNTKKEKKGEWSGVSVVV